MDRCARCIALALGLLAMDTAHAQPAFNDNRDDKGDDALAALAQFQSLSEEFKQLGDWEQNAELIRGVVDRVWKENNWDSESDQFARRTATEVSRIPPWDFSGRVAKMSEMVGERYAFDDRQRQRLESSIHAEAGWFLVKNFKSVWGLTRESIGTRAQGRPFTPEMIARWTRESDGLLADARERMDRIAKTMHKTMTAQQRSLLREDLQSFERRQAFTDRMRERWAQGQWRPEDWGLERDPIQSQGEPGSAQPSSQPAPAADPYRPAQTVASAEDESTWERYVRQFISRYALDAAQQEAAHSILRELLARAADYRSSRQREREGTRGRDSEVDSSTVMLRRMFDELKSRLEPIPTSAQRAKSTDGS